MATDGPERFCRSMERSTGDGFPSFFLTKDTTMTRRMDEMNEDDLAHYMTGLLTLIGSLSTPDTTGFILVMIAENGYTQYGSSISREDAPDALRELADRIEGKKHGRPEYN